MRDSELFAVFNARIERARQDAHTKRITALHNAQKAGISGPSLFVVVREIVEPEPLTTTAQFIKEHSL